MTGRDLVDYIVTNHYDDKELTIYINGTLVPVYDIVYDLRNLLVLTDCRKESEE